MSEMDTDWIAADLEPAADAANAAEPRVDWEGLGAVEREARTLAGAGRLTISALEVLLQRVQGLVPVSRPDIAEDLERDMRALINA